MNSLLSAIKAFVLKSRPAYKDYLGNGKYDIKKLPEECIPDSVDNKIKIVQSAAALKANPVFTGSFSQNRKKDSQVGDYSHAEGYSTTASGEYSHAEGEYTTASGLSSHAEGGYTTASGEYSHAEGEHTTASGSYSHVQGKYNIDDSDGKYSNIVGNGTSDTTRSNAHTLDWEGNAWYAGTVEGTAMIVKSSTPSSTKKFKITVDDTGTISATEVT